MFDVGQRVVVIAPSGITFDAIILARAKGDNGPGAYKVALYDNQEETGQWHKAGDVFLAEMTAQEERDSWDAGFLKE